jgi:hypothetical protein
MSYESRNTHSELYEIEGTIHTAKVDFEKERLWIDNMENSFNEWMNFEGSMQDFVESKINACTKPLK